MLKCLSLKFAASVGRFAAPQFDVLRRSVLAMGCSTSKITEKKPTQDEYVEAVVCQESDIKENEMKAFDLAGAGKILLVKQNGRLSAIGAKCTHYGAPLETGVLGEGRVRCPWHGACFSITSGDIEDFPGLDSLPCYQVEVKDNNVKVRGKRTEIESSKHVKKLCKVDTREEQHYVIIGGGPSGETCAETLRQNGFSGKITMVTKENILPYDRILLSKNMVLNPEDIQFRDTAYYMTNNIDVLKGTEACKVDTAKNQVTLSSGKVLDYSKLFVATGTNATKIPIPGSDLKNVNVLRNVDDLRKIMANISKEKHVVLLGSSFIAMEAAGCLVETAAKVTVIARDAMPFRPVLGPEIGMAVKKLFEDNGVHFLANSGMRACIGNSNGEVVEVELTNGDKLKADVVIMGVGGRLATEFLKDSGVNLEKNGAIEVNEYMQSNVENVYAGGDVASAPVYSSDNEKASIGHIGLAQYHGRMAGLNMLGKKEAIKSVPFFWTRNFEKAIQYAGHGKYDEILYTGSVQDLRFVAYFMSGDKVVAISACDIPAIVARYAERRSQGKQLYRQDLGEELLGWTK